MSQNDAFEVAHDDELADESLDRTDGAKYCYQKCTCRIDRV